MSAHRRSPSSVSLFVVDRRIDRLDETRRGLLREVLADATARLTSDGDPIRYVGTTFLPRRDRCLSYFASRSEDLVRVVNEAASAPVTSIDEAIWLAERKVPR